MAAHGQFGQGQFDGKIQFWCTMQRNGNIHQEIGYKILGEFKLIYFWDNHPFLHLHSQLFESSVKIVEWTIVENIPTKLAAKFQLSACWAPNPS
jgi:hypothetical protein